MNKSLVNCRNIVLREMLEWKVLDMQAKKVIPVVLSFGVAPTLNIKTCTRGHKIIEPTLNK